MSDRRIKLLGDVLAAVANVQAFVAGRTLPEHEASPLHRAAVERQFEIIGEALRRLLRLDPAMATRLPDAQEIIDFRNLIAHGYDHVDQRIVWGIIWDDLPRLLVAVQALYDQLLDQSQSG